MVTKYVLGTLAQNEDLHKKARVAYLNAYKAQYPNSKTKIQQNYLDRITGEVANNVIQLSTDGKDHSDRLDIPIRHGSPNIDKCLYRYDSEKENNPLKKDYYFKPSQRVSLGANNALIDLNKDEAKAQGFRFDDSTLLSFTKGN